MASFFTIYWFKTQRLAPASYPQADPESVMIWKQFRLNNCKRYAGLFMIYVLLLFVVSMIYAYSLKHHQIWMGQAAAYFELAYFTFCLGVVIYSSLRTRRYGKQLGVISNRFATRNHC